MAKIVTLQNTSKKAVILEKATQLFRQRGYNATSMRHLAEAVGVEAPSLYNHITSKSELLNEICFRVANAYLQQLEATENSQDGHAVKVEKIIRFHIRMMLDQFEAVYVSNRDWKHLPETALTLFIQERQQYEKRFATIIAQGIAEKAFKSVHPHVAVLTLLSAVRSIEFWQKNKRGLSATDMENDLVQILIQGLTK